MASYVPDGSPIYQEMDLRRRSGFAIARKAAISIRIRDKNGSTPVGLQESDFILTVNGVKRALTVHAPASTGTVMPPLVLLVFPPNQPVVCRIAVEQASKYFTALPAELLPWRVGILEWNGKLTAFTNGRSQLLAYLDAISHAPEPFEYANDLLLPTNAHWDGGWGNRAQEAISAMQSYDGRKVILAINPSFTPIYGAISGQLAQDGPATLVPTARRIGAHIYIANFGGPDAPLPGGDVSQDGYEINFADPNALVRATASGSLPTPIWMDPQLAASRSFSFRTSQMMQIAAQTRGGFSNSFKDLAAQIHRDLDNNYTLVYDLTPEEQDQE
jgi:hypothetical protein